MDRCNLEALSAGAVVMFRDHLVELVRFHRDDSGQLRVALRSDGQLAEVPYVEFCAGIGPVLRLDGTKTAVEPPDEPEWEKLPTQEKERITALAQELLQISTGSPTGNPGADRTAGRLDPRYDPLLTTRAQRLATKCAERQARQAKPYSKPQLLKLLDRFERDGRTGLAHRNHRAVRAHEDPAVMAALREFLVGTQSAARTSDETLAAMAWAALDANGFTLDFSAATWKRLLGEASRGLALHRQSRSRQTQLNKPKDVYGRLSAGRPGERVQVDATATTVHCWFPEIGWARANVLTAIDVYSRCILALRVVAGAPTSRDVGMLMWDIGRPAITRAGWPYELQYWHGMPRLATVVMTPQGPQATSVTPIGEKPAVHPANIVFDHGRENESIHLIGAANRAGIGITFSPPAAPHTKGIVESWHNALVEAQSLLPGFKGASPANHPRGIEAAAVLTVGDLHDALWEYVLTIYHHRKHEGLRDPANPVLKTTPASAFERYIENNGDLHISRDPWRLTAFLSTAECSLQDYGINIGRRVYNSSELLALRGRFQQGRGRSPAKVTAHYDRWDVSKVYLRHPEDKAWLMVPRWNPEGLTLAPYSEALTSAAIAEHLEGRNKPLSPTEVLRAEAQLHAAWNAGTFENRRYQRQAALEAARAAQYAHDLEDATDEFRDLAFPSRGALAAPITSYESDDDEVLDYGDVEPYGFAL
jgi:transposase InsO family protein